MKVIATAILALFAVQGLARRVQMPEPPAELPVYTEGSVHNILNFDAVANTSDSDLAAGQINGIAIYQAVQAANNAGPGESRSVLIPAGYKFTYVPYANIVGIYNVTIILDGILSFFDGDYAKWPKDSNGNFLNGIEIDKSSYVTLTSNSRRGAVSGNGLHWWWQNIFHGTHRPHMIAMSSTYYTVMEHWQLYNSPQYHIAFFDNAHALFQYVTIQVDIDGQRTLLKNANRWNLDLDIPTFPLNTDGIDVTGKNITIRNCHVENFDDAYCPKPNNKGSNVSACTTEVLVEDSSITNGVGASIGSVPPSRDVNCVANTTFRRISFDHPIKAIYVKPNPCPNGPAIDGTGIINNITYEDIYADTPLWWSIYVGTQQQEQPGGGADTGCSFFYPVPGTSCPTQGCVPVTNLYLKNVYMENSLQSPGLLRCNETGPCTGWEWTNVTIKTRSDWPVGSNNFLCHALKDPIFNNVSAGCVNETSSGVGSSMEQDTKIANERLIRANKKLI